jgi:hypothetical protein
VWSAITDLKKGAAVAQLTANCVVHAIFFGKGKAEDPLATILHGTINDYSI